MHYSSIVDMAAGIAAQATRRDAVIITPLLKLPADRSLVSIGALPSDSIWASHVLVSAGKRRFKAERVYFGLVLSSSPPGMTAKMLALRNASTATHGQATSVRTGLIEALRGLFQEVHTPDDPVENARICAQIWPGQQAARMLANVIAKSAASHLIGHA